MRWLVLLVFIAALAVLLTVCGQPESSEPAPDIPEWAHVAPQQIAEAKKHGVPVAFENDLGMRFVLIPEGRFVMGSPEDEEGRINHETQHEVTISKPFYMQITEVTNGEYRKYKPDHQSGAHDGHSLDGENQPVVEVSWEDAEAFAAWLGKQDPSRSYRLPTEAEWEHACRAGTRTAYAWGDDAAEGWRHANANDPMTKEAFGFPWDGWPRDDGHRVTAPVASYPTNVWGLYDLSGTCRSGARTGTGSTRGDGQRIRRDRRAALGAFFAAGRGTTTRGTSVPRIAAGTTPTSGSSAAAFGWSPPSPNEGVGCEGRAGGGSSAPSPTRRGGYLWAGEPVSHKVPPSYVTENRRA